MKAGWIVLILGMFILGVSFLVCLISAMMPILNGPRVSWKEAMLGIAPGSCGMFLGLLVAGIGVVLLVAGKKK